MNSRVLLLDFDGVLYSNKSAHKIIADRSTRYCNRFIKSHNKVFVENFHQNLYKTHGHSVVGLQKIGYDANITDYNNYCFSNLDFNNIDNDLDNSKSINELINNLRYHNINTYLFSNAPNVWTVPLLRKMNINISENNILEMNKLKPTLEVYQDIEDIFKGHQLYFVDDNMINFTNIMNNPKWMKILYANTRIDIKDDLKVINELEQIDDLIV